MPFAWRRADEFSRNTVTKCSSIAAHGVNELWRHPEPSNAFGAATIGTPRRTRGSKRGGKN